MITASFSDVKIEESEIKMISYAPPKI